MPDNTLWKQNGENNKTIYRKRPLSGYTMTEAAEIWVQSQKSHWKAGTYTVYTQRLTKYILPFFGDKKIHKITEETMEQFVADLDAQTKNTPLSENYISQLCGTVRRILLYMEKKYPHSVSAPCNPVVRQRTRRVLLPETDSLWTLERYLSLHCEEDTCLGILIAFHTGIRIGELSALTWQDIDVKEGLLYVRNNIQRVKNENAQHTADGKMTRIVQQTPKTSDSVRIVPLPEKLLPLLRQYQKESGAYVIRGVKNPWAEPRTIQYRFKHILGICGITYFNFHMLRHAFATRCVSMGLDVKSLSEILGHSSIQITLNLYVHTTIQQKKRFMDQYNSCYILS